MNLFSRNPDVNAVQVLTESSLKRKAASDKYWNNKKVEDAIHTVIRWAIFAVAFLGFLSVCYFIYYYQWSDKKNPSTLLDAAKAMMVYIAGIVTPTIHKVLGGKKED